MTEEPQDSSSPTPEDLESLLGGLDFTPNWAKGEPGVTSPGPRERNGKDRRGGQGPRKPRESSRRGLQGVRVKPRRTSPNRNDGGGSPAARREFGDDRRGRGPAPSRPPRPPRVPVHVDFIPEKKRLSKVVRVIRQSHKIYPLRVVAEKFMENPAYISMKYTVKEKDPDATDFQLYVCRANGMVFSNEQACIQYVVEHGVEANYEAAEKEVPPPAGNFVCVGRHRPSGRLIGPPNWHGYQTRLQELRVSMAPETPPEHFAADIEMVHEAEVIEAWKKEVSVQTFYREKKEEPTLHDEVVTEEDVPVPETEETPPEETTETAGDIAPEADGTQTDELSEDATEPAPAEEPPVATADDRPYEWTRDQVEAHFRETYLPKLVGKTKRHILPGYLYGKMTDPSLLSLTEFHLRREHGRPNSIIFALRPAFKHMRLHVFRFDGQLMVGGVAQHPLPEGQKIAPEIQSIVDYVAANPGCNTQEALKSVCDQVEEIPAETVSHFRWLIEKGHLLEFHDDTLHLPHGKSEGTK